jgi:transcriptional regulator GlxA family with amidase domain
VPDRLRDLLDLVVGSLDERDADGRALARRAHFSRDHLDRMLAGATGESPVALRRRLLLERAAWQLRTGAATPTQAAAGRSRSTPPTACTSTRPRACSCRAPRRGWPAPAT